MVTKSTQTQYGGKFDGQFHKKGPKRLKSKEDTPPTLNEDKINIGIKLS